ncbi:MAG: TraK family protein [Enterovibrio sp.]
MKMDYMQELSEWANQKKIKPSQREKHVVAFLAVRDDVKRALDNGYTMKTVWEHLRETGRISSRYETFTLHVKRFIRAETVTVKKKPAEIKNEKKPLGFTYNRIPREEDLI